MIQTQSADGVIHQFPDGTDPAVIDKAMLDYAQSTTAKPQAAPTDSAAAPAPKGVVANVTGFMANLNRGLGFGDELAAGIKTARDVVTGHSGPDVVQTYKDELAGQRAIEDGYAAAHPMTASLARGTGNAGLMLIPAGPGAEAFAGGNLMTNAARGATVAGLTGAGYAAADRGTLSQRMTGAAQAAHDPVTLGLGAVAGGMATVRPPKATSSPAPTLEQLTDDKDAAYRAVDNSGVRYTPEAMKGLSNDINTALADARFNPRLHTKAAPILDQIAEDVNSVVGYSPSLTELDQLRRQVRGAVANSADADERRIGGVILGRIDNFINTAGPDAITGGDPVQSAAMISKARALNTQVEKLRSLDNLDEAAADRAGATGTGANIGNATRQNVIRFQNQTGNLTPDEQAATTRVIRGTMTGNTLRAVGSLSPEGGTVRAATSIATGAMSHGVIPGAGYVAKRISDAITAKNVQALRDLIATGGQAAAEVSRQLADPAYAELRAQLANDLSVQAGVQGTARRGSVTATVEGHPEYGVGVSRR